MSRFRPPGDVGPRLATLEQRVTGIESALGSLGAGIDKLGAKLDARSTTQWPAIWSATGVAVGILTAIGTLVYRPIDAAQVRLDHDLRTVQAQVVSRAELEGRWRQTDRDYDFMRARIGRIEDRATQRIERLEERVFAKP